MEAQGGGKGRPNSTKIGISENGESLINLIHKEGWTEKNKDHYSDLLNKVYEEEQLRPNLKPTTLRNNQETDAINDFRRWGFEEVNEKLRNGTALNKEEKQMVDIIDRVISRTKLKEDIVVYRGTQYKPSSVNKGYSSTSRNITTAEHFSSEMYGSKHLYAYRIPKGTNALIIGGAEDEIVLPRNFNLGKYRIK